MKFLEESFEELNFCRNPALKFLKINHPYSDEASEDIFEGILDGKLKGIRAEVSERILEIMFEEISRWMSA